MAAGRVSDGMAYKQECFCRAQTLAGLKLALTGLLGRRTRFQERSTAQLVLVAENSEQTGAPSCVAAPVHPTPLPHALALNDDVLLDQLHLDAQPAADRQLRAVDQAIVLAVCLSVKGAQPRHGLVNEEMLSYVDRVLKHPVNWTVHTMALLIRSRLEAERFRTVERSVMQLQALVDQFHDGGDGAGVRERFTWLFCVAIPPIWALEVRLPRFRVLKCTASRVAISPSPL